MERFWQKQIKLGELTQPRWGDMANNYRERDKQYRMTGLKVPAVIRSQMDQVVAAPSLTTFGELIETLDIVPGISRMPQDTSQPGSSQMGLGSGKPHSPKRIPSLQPSAASDWAQTKYAMAVELV